MGAAGAVQERGSSSHSTAEKRAARHACVVRKACESRKTYARARRTTHAVQCIMGRGMATRTLLVQSYSTRADTGTVLCTVLCTVRYRTDERTAVLVATRARPAPI